MAIRPLLKYRNPDSTLDLNTTQARIIDRAIFNGGDLTLSSTSFQVTVAPFIAVGYDGMVSISDDPETRTVPSPAVAGPDKVSYLVLWAAYRELQSPVTILTLVDEATWTTGSEKDYYITFARFTVPFGATDLTDPSVDVDYSFGDWGDKLGKTGWRAPSADFASLPTTQNRDGDVRVALDTRIPWSWDEASDTWVSLTMSSFWKDPVANLAALPGVGNATGDVRQTLDTMFLYTWDGATWQQITFADPEARIAIFETDGLDAAYRGGLTATAGIGRIITKDGGAVETQSATAAMYEDDVANAHYRADARGDTVGGTGGFDFVSDRDPEAVVTGTGGAGYLDRRALAIQPGGFGSYFQAPEAADLNPGGGAASTIRLTTGGRYFYSTAAGPTPPAGNYSNLHLNVDLIEITGGTNPGLYLVSALGAATTDVQVVALDGSAPSFVADESVSVTVYRPQLATWGSEFSGSRGVSSGTNIIVGTKSSGPGITLIGGDESNGSDMLRTYRADGDGTHSAAMRIDKFGRLTWLNHRSEEFPNNFTNAGNPALLEGGAFATKVQRSGGSSGRAEFTHIVTGEGDNNVNRRFDFTSMRFLEDGGSGTNLGSISFDFIADSPTFGELDVSGATLAGDWRDHLVSHFTLAEITAPTAQAGYYFVRATLTGPDRVVLNDLDGTYPPTSSTFPTFGSGTIRFYSGSWLGRHGTRSVDELTATVMTTVTPYATFGNGPESNSVAVTTYSLPAGAGLARRCHLRGFRMDAATDPLPKEVYSLTADGDFITAGQVYAYDNVVANAGLSVNSGGIGVGSGNITLGGGGEYLYATPVSRTIQLNLVGANWFVLGSATVPQFTTLLTGAVLSQEDSATLGFDLKQYLPNGAEITQVRCIVNPGAARANPNNMTMSLHQVTPNYGAFTSTPTTLFNVRDDETTNAQVIDTGAVSHTLNFALNSYMLVIQAGDDGGVHNTDTISAVEITFDDPGPRNF